jgi:hypothetical protein
MQITFLNGEQAILYINKDAVQNTLEVCLVRHSTLNSC